MCRTLTLSKIGKGSPLGFLVVVSFLSIFLGKPLLANALGGLSSSPDPLVAIHPPELVVDPEATFTIEVLIEDASDLVGYEFNMEFNPSVVEVLDVEDGGFLGSTGRTVILLGPDLDNEAGTVTFGAVSMGDASGPEGAGELAIITLKAVGEGVTDLNLQDVKLADTSAGQMVATVEDGRVQVGEGPLPTRTPTEVATATPTETSIATVTRTPTGIATPTSTATSTNTPLAGQTQVTASPTVTSGPTRAATEALEPTATSTNTPLAGQTQATTSPTVTSGPTRAATEALEPTATSTGEVVVSKATESPRATPAASATPQPLLASESGPTATLIHGQEARIVERPVAESDQGEQTSAGGSMWLIGAAMLVGVVGIIAAGVYLLAPKRVSRGS